MSPAGSARTGLRSAAVAAAAASTVTAIATAVYLYRRRQRRAASTADEAPTKTAAQRELEEFAKRTASDNKVHFFTFPVLSQLAPSITPYGVRVEVFMRMHNIPYEKHTDPNLAASPNGCVPYVCYKGRVVADSQQIMEFLDTQFNRRKSKAASGGPDDAGAAEEAGVDRALEAAVRAVTNYSLSPALVRSVCYEDPRRTCYRYIIASLNIIRDSNPLAPLLRFAAATVFKRLLHAKFTTTGLMLLSKEQFEEIFLHDLESVESLLAEQPFIAGTSFSTADAVLYSFLLLPLNMRRAERARRLARIRGARASADGGASESALTPAEEEAIADAAYVNDTLTYAYESEILNAYVDRITAKAFPDMDEILNLRPARTVRAHSDAN